MRRIAQIIAAYDDPLVRAYCSARFRIIHQGFLDEILQFLPRHGKVLELGCGFGLFGLYFALSCPDLNLIGYDIDARRIRLARRARDKLGADNMRFEVGDARTIRIAETYQAFYLLDMLHHLPPEFVPQLLGTLHERLEPGGILIVKDVDTFPRRKRWFTWALDLLMTGGEQPHYWASPRLVAELRALGFQVFSHAMVDVLPYPHRVYYCFKGDLDRLNGA